MEQNTNSVLTQHQSELLDNITNGSGDPLKLPECLESYEDLLVDKRKDLVSLAETFETKFRETKKTDFKCTYLRIELSTACELKSCPFRVKNKEFFNCSLYYHHTLKSKNGLSNLDIGALQKQNPREIKKVLHKSLLKVQRSILKEAINVSPVADDSSKPSSVMRLERIYHAPISNILETTFGCFKDSDIIASVLRLKKKTLALYCERYLGLEYDHCLYLHNISVSSPTKKRRTKPSYDINFSLSEFKKFPQKLVGKYSFHCDNFSDLLRRLRNLN